MSTASGLRIEPERIEVPLPIARAEFVGEFGVMCSGLQVGEAYLAHAFIDGRYAGASAPVVAAAGREHFRFVFRPSVGPAVHVALQLFRVDAAGLVPQTLQREYP